MKIILRFMLFGGVFEWLFCFLFNKEDDEGKKMVMMFIIFLGLFIFNNEIFFIKRFI